MKIYELMLGIFLCTYMMSFFSQLITGVGMPPEYEVPAGYNNTIFTNHTMKNNLTGSRIISYINESTEQVELITKEDKTILETLDSYFIQIKMVAGSIGIFLRAFWDCTGGLIPFLLDLGVPAPLTALLSVITYFIYSIGIFQIITGRDLKEGA